MPKAPTEAPLLGHVKSSLGGAREGRREAQRVHAGAWAQAYAMHGMRPQCNASVVSTACTRLHTYHSNAKAAQQANSPATNGTARPLSFRQQQEHTHSLPPMQVIPPPVGEVLNSTDTTASPVVVPQLEAVARPAWAPENHL